MGVTPQLVKEPPALPSDAPSSGLRLTVTKSARIFFRRILFPHFQARSKRTKVTSRLSVTNGRLARRGRNLEPELLLSLRLSPLLRRFSVRRLWQYHRASLCARNYVPSFLHLRPLFPSSAGYRGHTAAVAAHSHKLRRRPAGRPEGNDDEIIVLIFFFLLLLLIAVWNKCIGRRREGKEGDGRKEESAKNVFPGMFSTSVCLSTRSFRGGQEK